MKRWFQSQPDAEPEDAELDQLLRCGLKRELGAAPPKLSFHRVRARVLDDQPVFLPAMRGGGLGGGYLNGISLLFYVLNSSPRAGWNSVPA
ncbi:MAG TPA: hypothetical protein VGE07_07190 [Herpetosiphonaceae bacterium]